MSEGVCVYTANIGGRDFAFSQVAQARDDVVWLYITDDPRLDVPAPWERILVPPSEKLHPNLTAKWHRCHPPQGYEYTIWLDANMQVTRDYFVTEALNAVSDDGVATWAHPRRTTVRDEVDASLGAEAQGGRYDHLPMREQYAAYVAEGFPDDVGLYATGTMVWTEAAARVIGPEWYAECMRWGYQDQVSFPVVCWRNDITPGVFPIMQTERRVRSRRAQAGWWGNRWMLLHDHAPGTGGA